MSATTVYILAVVFVATVIRSAFGFGEALIAVPLLALVLPVNVATPLMVMLSVTVALVVVLQDWREVHLRSTGWLFGATLPGLPLGIALLANAHQQAVKILLAAVIALFATYFLLRRSLPHLERDHRGLMLACGFSAGVFGGAYGMNGPPLVMYGALRRWDAQSFRATLQAYFLPAGVLSLAGYAWTGLWTRAVSRDYVVALAAAVPAIFVGRAINRRLRGDAFLKYVYAGLLVIAGILFVQAMRQG